MAGHKDHGTIRRGRERHGGAGGHVTGDLRCPGFLWGSLGGHVGRCRSNRDHMDTPGAHDARRYHGTDGDVRVVCRMVGNRAIDRKTDKGLLKRG